MLIEMCTSLAIEFVLRSDDTDQSYRTLDNHATSVIGSQNARKRMRLKLALMMSHGQYLMEKVMIHNTSYRQRL